MLLKSEIHRLKYIIYYLEIYLTDVGVFFYDHLTNLSLFTFSYWMIKFFLNRIQRIKKKPNHKKYTEHEKQKSLKHFLPNRKLQSLVKGDIMIRYVSIHCNWISYWSISLSIQQFQPQIYRKSINNQVQRWSMTIFLECVSLSLELANFLNE